MFSRSWFASFLLLAGSMSAAEPLRIVTTIAGTPGVAGFQDGPAAGALFNKPTWLDIVTSTRTSDYAYKIELGDIFVVDRQNNAVRKISRRTVYTEIVRRNYYDSKSEVIKFDFDGPFGGGIVVEASGGGCGAGPWDRGMHVVNSGTNQIALVAPLTIVTSIGNRDEAFTILGAPNTAGAIAGPSYDVRFNTPTGIARSRLWSFSDISRQALFVADTGSHTIRRITFRFGAEGCPGPAQIITFAGSEGMIGSADGVGKAARFNTPRGVATATDESVYVTDSGNHTIRRIAVDGTVTTVAGEAGVPGSDDGPARQAHLNGPSGIDVDNNGEIYISDTGNHTIRKLTSDGQLITIAGTPGLAGFADGDASQALFNGPAGIKVDVDGALIVADISNHVIRRVVVSQSEPGPRRRSVRH